MRTTLFAAALATTCLCAPALAASNMSAEQGHQPQSVGAQQNNSNSTQGAHTDPVRNNATTGQASPAEPRARPSQPNAVAGQGDAGMTSGAASSAPAQMNSASQAGASAMKATGGQVQYVTQNDPNVWSAKEIDGVDVYNDQNEKVGAIDDVLLDRNGQVKAVVIGVGGFLGLGEHDVAVSFNSLQWQMKKNNASNGSVSGQTTGANPNATAANTGAARTGDAKANRDAPVRAILPGATKDALKNAPQFKYAD